MKNLFLNLFAPTVASLTSHMTKTVDRLHALADRHVAAADAHVLKSQELMTAADGFAARALEARQAAARFAKLLA